MFRILIYIPLLMTVLIAYSCKTVSRKSVQANQKIASGYPIDLAKEIKDKGSVFVVPKPSSQVPALGLVTWAQMMKSYRDEIPNTKIKIQNTEYTLQDLGGKFKDADFWENHKIDNEGIFEISFPIQDEKQAIYEAYLRQRIPPDYEITSYTTDKNSKMLDLVITRPSLSGKIFLNESEFNKLDAVIDRIILKSDEDLVFRFENEADIGLARERLKRQFGELYRSEVKGFYWIVNTKPRVVSSSYYDKKVHLLDASEAIEQIKTGDIAPKNGGVLIVAPSKLIPEDLLSRGQFSEVIQNINWDLTEELWNLFKKNYGDYFEELEIKAVWVQRGENPFLVPNSLAPVLKEQIKPIYNKSINSYKDEFCYASACVNRANLLSIDLNKNGIESKNRYIVTAGQPIKKQWGFHVGSIVNVKNDIDSNLISLALDPITGVIPSSEWTSDLLFGLAKDDLIDLKPNSMGIMIIPKGKYCVVDVPQNVFLQSRDPLVDGRVLVEFETIDLSSQSFKDLQYQELKQDAIKYGKSSEELKEMQLVDPDFAVYQLKVWE